MSACIPEKKNVINTLPVKVTHFFNYGRVALKAVIDSLLQIIILHLGSFQCEVLFAYVPFSKNIFESITISELSEIYSVISFQSFSWNIDLLHYTMGN